MDIKYFNSNSKKTMTVKEFSSSYSIGSNKAYEIVNRDDFPKIRCGRKIIIITSKVDEWFEKQLGNQL